MVGELLCTLATWIQSNQFSVVFADDVGQRNPASGPSVEDCKRRPVVPRLLRTVSNHTFNCASILEVRLDLFRPSIEGCAQ